MDIFGKCKNSHSPLGQYEKFEGDFIFPKLSGPIANRMNFKGREVIVWSVNNYLGLANHPEVIEADRAAAKEHGMAYPMGSRLMSGNTSEHESLEQLLADFVGKNAGFLINYGYQAVLSAIDALTDRKDVVVYDRQCHACIIDGVRLHKGRRFSYIYNDIDHLEGQLRKASEVTSKTKGGILLITEGVFGMLGQQGRIREISRLKSKFDFRIMVDDAHGFGTLGDNGRGVGSEQEVTDEIDIYFSTFAKSMAGIGGFFAADSETISYLKYNTRSQIFAKSLPMPMVIGAMKRLELIKAHPELKETLWRNARRLQKGLRENGMNIGSTNSVITPVILQGGVNEAIALTRDLRDGFGIFCSIVVYPVVPKGAVILRIIPTAVHTNEDIDHTVLAFAQVRSKLDDKAYS